MVNPQIKTSGLAAKFAMSSVVDSNDVRAKWLGKTVRYKRSCDWIKFGTMARDYEFEVREVQNDYKGDPIVRIYCIGYDDTFGRACSLDNLEMIS